MPWDDYESCFLAQRWPLLVIDFYDKACTKYILLLILNQ